MKQNNKSIITIVRHFISVNRKEEFENWITEISSKIKQFNGFEGLQLISSPQTSCEYLFLFRFSNAPDLNVWMNSSERKSQIKKLNKFSEKKMVLEKLECSNFKVNTINKKISEAPPKWKTSILTWVAVFPSVVFLSKFYHILFPSLSSLVLTFFVTLSLVTILTWGLMPVLVKLFKKWLQG